MAKQPEGIDDISKAIMAAIKKARAAGEFVSDVSSDRYARARYSTIPKAKANVKNKIAAHKDQKIWMMPDGTPLPKRQAKKILKKDGVIGKGKK